ncbi:LLM class flavin-dependent oxidoreductase [Nitratireductor soli]|uniref:LLM class flavin-dependent oxidoreductase n=1 Tax=Nitratireductor soli TaxID=1670619 RepID=UPI000A46E0F3|nr:LLM class flavin-dependent oxidoreductase [Nitratireductor soli]
MAEISPETTGKSAMPARRPAFSVGLRADPANFAAFIRQADELGFAGLWVQDTLNDRNFSLDPLHQLSYAAAVSKRMRLGISVLFSGYRNPAVLARELATIDQLSSGRLTVGLGVGNAYHRPRLAALGIQTDRPVPRLIEGIGVMRALWGEEEASYQGEIYAFSGIRSQPKPIQRPGPPILIGARNEKALRRAVAIADGWTGAAMIPHEQRNEELAILDDELAATGRDRASFTISVNVYTAVDPDRDVAHRRVQEVLSKGFKDNPVYDAGSMAERVAVFGSAEECAETYRRMLDQGIDELVLHPMYDPAIQLERLARTVELVRAA